MNEEEDYEKGLLSNVLAGGFLRRRGTIWVSFFLLWLALGLFSASTFLVQLPRVRRSAPPQGVLSPVSRSFIGQLIIWLAWVGLAPVALWLRRRWSFERGAIKRALPVHLTAVVVLCAAHSGVVLLADWFVIRAGEAFTSEELRVLLVYWWLRDLPFCALFYALVLGIGSALDYY